MKGVCKNERKLYEIEMMLAPLYGKKTALMTESQEAEL